MQELCDLVEEDILEHLSCEFDAFIVVEAGICCCEFFDDFKSATEHRWLVSQFAGDVGDVRGGIFYVFACFVGTFYEDAFEVVSRPLDCVFDLMREVLQRAEGNAFFWRVNRVTVGLGEFWDDYL